MSERRHLTIVPGILTRGDCKDGPRPCPMASCRYHIVPELVAAHTNRRLPEGWAEAIEAGDFGVLPETCILDVADRGGAPFEDIAALFAVSRQRIEQTEWNASAKIRSAVSKRGGRIALEAQRAEEFAGHERPASAWDTYHGSETGGDYFEADPLDAATTSTLGRAYQADLHERFVDGFYDAYRKAYGQTLSPPRPVETPESITLVGVWAEPVRDVPDVEDAPPPTMPEDLTELEQKCWQVLFDAGGSLRSLGDVARLVPELERGCQNKGALNQRARHAMRHMRLRGLVAWARGTAVYIPGMASKVRPTTKRRTRRGRPRA